MKNSLFFRFTFIVCFTVLSISPVQATQPQKVSAALAKTLTFYPQQDATAVAKALNHPNVPAQISAQVFDIPVLRGDTVSKGQLLVKLDCQDQELALALARSQLAIAKTQWALTKRSLKRSMTLHKNKNIGEAQLDNSQVDVEIAELKVAELETNMLNKNLAVQRCDITAPFDGIVTKRLISKGDYVVTGQGLLNVVERNNIEIQAQVPVHHLSKLINGTQYQFISNGKPYDISLKAVVNFIESNSQSQIVSFSVPDNAVIAGAQGMITWQTKAPYFPAHLLTQVKEQYGVFIIEDNKAAFVAVKTAQEGRPFTLLLDDNSQIIIDGRHRVSHGDDVSIATQAE